MKTVEVRAVVGDRAPEDAYAVLCNFESYPELCEGVRSVAVSHQPDGSVISNWEVDLQLGVFKWAEQDTFDLAGRRIAFKQLAGDIDYFAGGWEVQGHDTGSQISFKADFDLGIPVEMAETLDPMAAMALRDRIRMIISGLFAAQQVDFSEA